MSRGHSVVAQLLVNFGSPNHISGMAKTSHQILYISWLYQVLALG